MHKIKRVINCEFGVKGLWIENRLQTLIQIVDCNTECPYIQFKPFSICGCFTLLVIYTTFHAAPHLHCQRFKSHWSRKQLPNMKDHYHLCVLLCKLQRASRNQKLNPDTNQTLSSSISFNNQYIWALFTGCTRSNGTQIKLCVCVCTCITECLFALCAMRLATAHSLLPSISPPQSVLCCLSLKSNREGRFRTACIPVQHLWHNLPAGGSAFMPQGY